jgi:hypothetical protein
VVTSPGRQPADAPPVVATPEAPPTRAAEPEAPKTDTQLADAMKRGAEQERSNNPEAWYAATYVDVVA